MLPTTHADASPFALPTPDVLDDDALFAAFATATLPKADFHHREHLRVAFIFLARHGDFGEGAVAFRAALRRFAETHGITRVLHETLTWAYLALVHERMASGRFADSRAFLAAWPDLLDHKGGALARCYDVAAITASPAARAMFVLPGARHE
jgi:hypothetical protein